MAGKQQKSKRTAGLYLSKETIQSYRCPKCAAEPHEPCYSYGGHGMRVANHAERRDHAMSIVGAAITQRR